MVATTTLASIVQRLARDFPEITFTPSDVCAWSPTDRSVSYRSEPSLKAIAELLHEASHGILQHAAYTRGIELLTMERQAWEYAVHQLAPRYGVTLSMEDQVVQDALDTYRDWLHARSVCPACGAAGIETKSQHYHCLHCHTTWRVNDARTCQLRRYTI